MSGGAGREEAVLEVAMILEENAESFLEGGENHGILLGLVRESRRLAGGEGPGEDEGLLEEALLGEFCCVMLFSCTVGALIAVDEQCCASVKAKSFPVLACAARRAGWNAFEWFIETADRKLDQYASAANAAVCDGAEPKERVALEAASNFAALVSHVERSGVPPLEEPHLLANLARLLESTYTMTVGVLTRGR